jgi:glycosyltransferase involved in cell wall biosynthesis
VLNLSNGLFMPDQPLISVVMPVYNHAAYVEKAVRSVFAQTVRPLEFIIIDDGSSDDSPDIVERVIGDAPEGITVHFHTRENRGAHVTLNEGLSRAQGRWLTVLNSDDAYMPDRLEICLAALEAAGGRLAFTYVTPVDGHDVPLKPEARWRQWYSDGILQELDQAPSLSTLLLSRNLAVSTGNLVFARALYHELGGFRDFRYAHDIDFVLRACLTDEPVLIRTPLYRYRLHGSNTISESDEATEREYEDIVHHYLNRTLAGERVNTFAPSLDHWSASISSVAFPPHVRRAMDRLLDGPPSYLAAASARKEAEDTALPVTTERNIPKPGLPGVTLVSHELSYTGAPVLLRDVAAGLSCHGFSGRLVSLVEGPLGGAFGALGFPIVREWRLTRLLTLLSRYANGAASLPRVPPRLSQVFSRAGQLLAGTARQLRLWRFLNLTRLDRSGVLLVNSFASFPLALPLAERWKGRVVWYIHETYDPAILMRQDRLHRRLRDLVDTGRITMLFGSDATRAVWARYGYDGVVRYWSGASREGRQAVADRVRRRVLLSVQSIGTRKGTRRLVEAFAEGRRTGCIPPDVELRIVGCHPPSVFPLTRDLIVRVNEPDLRGSVRLISALPPAALNAHYEAADAYVQSSIMECLPLALLNAMEHGLPIVSTDADGCREAIEDGETGLLVPLSAPDRLAKAIGRILTDEPLAHRLGGAARQRFEERFCIEATLPALIDSLMSATPETKIASYVQPGDR